MSVEHTFCSHIIAEHLSRCLRKTFELHGLRRASHWRKPAAATFVTSDTQASAQVRAVLTVHTCNLKSWGHLYHLGLLVLFDFHKNSPPLLYLVSFSLLSPSISVLWQKTRLGTRAATGGERMCEVQPEWNVRVSGDHSDTPGTLFVLIASREGKQQPVLTRCFLSVLTSFFLDFFLKWILPCFTQVAG